MINVARSTRNIRSMVGVYVVDIVYVKVDNFGRLYYGETRDNLHGLMEPYYEHVGTLIPEGDNGGVGVLRQYGTSDESWVFARDYINALLIARAVG